jgi:WS/DGAT/MGAT family acyltransferase
VNDVMLSLAAGALRDYLLGKGDAVEGLEIRAIVPVNLRPPDAPVHLGNQFGLVFLELPLGLSHPLERLYEIRRRMRALKGSYQPAIALALLATVGQTPGVVQDQVTSFLAANASAVMTNVPGPQQPLYLAGKRITGMEFWVPQSGGIGMGISILSYDGRVHFGIVTDAGLVPDPRRIVGRFGDEFAKLMWLTLMSPWQ